MTVSGRILRGQEKNQNYGGELVTRQRWEQTVAEA
jgi:hypothetical protein